MLLQLRQAAGTSIRTEHTLIGQISLSNSQSSISSSKSSSTSSSSNSDATTTEGTSHHGQISCDNVDSSSQFDQEAAMSTSETPLAGSTRDHSRSVDSEAALTDFGQRRLSR